jgi:glycosyltransferase involved in cell wall biosynthesis
MNEKKRPQVSVCIATYNQEKYIADCVLSVLSQRFDVALEVLIGDDCSHDKTTEILAEIESNYPAIVKIYRHTQNLGASANYQFLISRSSAPFIAHLDGDDYWLPGKLREQISFLSNHPECAAVYSNAIAIDDKNELIGVFNNHQASVFDLDFLVEKGNFLNHSSLLYRCDLRSVILEITGEFIDYRMHLRLAKLGKIGFLNQVLVGYRVYSTTSMIANIPDKVRQLYWEALLDVRVDCVRPMKLAKGVAAFLGSTLRFTLQKYDFPKAVTWSRKIVRESPVSSSLVLLIMLIEESSGLIRKLIRKIRRRFSSSQLIVLFER